MRPPAIAPRRIRSLSDRSVMCIEFSMLPCLSFWTNRMSTTRMTPRFRTRRSSAMILPVASNLSNPMTKTWIGPVTCLSAMCLFSFDPAVPATVRPVGSPDGFPMALLRLGLLARPATLRRPRRP